ncbi:MAG: redoxin family protein [Bryobacteraceae bacterium]
MDNDKNFVDEQLSALREPEGFTPSAARARVQLKVRQAPSSRRWLWTAVPVAAVALIAMALPVSRAVANMQSPPIAFEHIHYMLAYHWDALIGMVHGGQTAPNFKLTDQDGQVVKLSSFRGKVVLLNFWATWCEPCKAEVPWFVDLQKIYADDLVVLGVSFDEDGWKAVRPFIESRHVNYPVMLAGPDLPDQYRKIESLPATLMINRFGRIVGTHLGLASKARYDALVREQL